MDRLCQICESAPASYQCRQCGALVCSAYYDEETGLSADCGSRIDETPSDEQPSG